MTPVSIPYAGIPGLIIFWVLFAVAFGLFLNRMYLLVRLIGRGQPENRFDNFGRRIKDAFIEVVTQWCNFKTLTRQDRSGIGHALMFWGFSLFFLNYIIFIGLAGGFGLSALSGGTFEVAYSSILDIAALAVIGSIGWAAVRRYILKPERLEVSLEAGIILVMVTLLMLLHFSVEGFGYAFRGIPDTFPPIGANLARLFDGMSTGALQAGYSVSWWLHYALILGFMIYIPYSKHLHILTSPFNVLFQRTQPKGTINLVEPEKVRAVGVAKVEDFTWKNLLDLYTCTVCGRCHEQCPARMSGKPLDPKEVVLNLKEHLLEEGTSILKGQTSQNGKSMIKDVITEEVIWDCTTCYACTETCPVSIEQMVKIIEMRRALVEHGQLSPTVTAALEGMRLLGNPWEKPQSARMDWTEGREVNLIQEKGQADVLYWVGCAGSYDPRSRGIALAMLNIFEKAGVDYAVLGIEEKCCGDMARRMGEEGLFQKLAKANIETLNKYRFNKIVMVCPHGFNTFKNEYPQLGGKFEVVHHSEFILELIKSGKINLNEQELKLTFHDPCYLGRYNGMYDFPREVLKSIPKASLTEMESHHARALCCGAGGGQLWIQSGGGRRIEDMRFEQAQKTGADVVATACPYCAIMLDAAAQIKEPGGKLKVMDIAELVNKVMK